MAQLVKNLPANAGDTSSISGSRRFSGEEYNSPLHYSCLGNPMDRVAWLRVRQDLTTKQQQHSLCQFCEIVRCYYPILQMWEWRLWEVAQWVCIRNTIQNWVCWFHIAGSFHSWTAEVRHMYIYSEVRVLEHLCYWKISIRVLLYSIWNFLPYFFNFRGP